MSFDSQSGRLAMLKRIAKHVPTPSVWTLAGGTWSHSDGRTFASWWRGQWRDDDGEPWFGAPDGHPNTFERVVPR